MSAKTRQFFGGILTIVGYATTAFGFGYFLIAAGAVLSYSGARQMQKEAERRARAGGRLDALRGNVRGSHEHHVIVAGRARIGGLLASAGNTDGPDMPNQHWHVAIEHSVVHPGGCGGLMSGYRIWVDETVITGAQVSGDPNTGMRAVTHPDYTDIFSIRHYKGTGTQAKDVDLETANIDAPNAYRRGIQWTYGKFTRPNDDAKYQKAYKFGFPQLSVEASGWLCYDPRLDTTNGGSGAHRYTDPLTWAWTDNPALFAATYDIVASSDGGAGLDPASVIWSSVAAAANVCDELISTPAGDIKRFRLGGVLNTSDPIGVNRQKILDAMMGVRVPVGEKYAYHAKSYRAPTVSIGRDWLAGGFRVRSRDPLESVYNFVRVNYNDSSLDYKTVEAPAYVNATYETQDGGRRLPRDLNLPMVFNNYQAQYLSQIIGKQSRYQMTLELVCNLRALDVEVWETCTVAADAFPGIDLSGKVFRVMHWEPEGEVIKLVLREDHSSIYTVETFQTPSTGSTYVPGAETPPAPTNVSAFPRPDGIRVSWTPPAIFLYRSIDILRSADNVTFAEVGQVGRSTSYFTDRVTDGGTYYYKLRARGLSAFSVFSNTAGPVTAKMVGDGSAQLAFNLGFESGNADWAIDSGRWSIVNDSNAQSGSWCAKFTSTGTAVTDVIRNSKTHAVAPGDLVTVYGFLKSSAGADGTAHWRISWLNSAGAEIGTQAGNSVSPSGNYIQSRVVGVAPASTAYARIEVVGANISAGQWYADNGYITVTPKSVDEIPDGPVYGRPKQTALTAGEVDLSKAGVIQKSADNIAEAPTRKWAAESGAQVVTGKSWTLLTDRNLGNIADDATYGRTKLTALTSGEVDLSKAGVLNRNADNISEASTRKWAAESGAQVVTGKSIDILADGATYSRTKGTALTAGEVDLSKAGVINKTADNVTESGTRKWAAESGAQVVTGKSLTLLVDRNLGNIADDATYGRTKLTALTAGEVDLSKAGVLNRNGDNIAESATRKWAAESGAQVFTGKSWTGLIDRTLGNIADDATYGRTKLTALTAGEVDLSKAGVLNRNGDNIAESATRKWAAESGAQVFTGKSLTGLVDRTLANIADGTDRFAGVQPAVTGDGFQILSNPDFAGGVTTGYSVYDNGGSGSVTLTAEADTTAPNSSGYRMKVAHTTAGSPAPGWGGFYRAIGPDSGPFAVDTYHRGATILWRIRANIPVGYSVNWASNATGNEGSVTWLTDVGGTGGWKDYVLKQVIGTTGTFSSTGFFYISGGTRPFDWYVAACSGVCVSFPQGFGISAIDANRRPITDFASSHINKNVDNVGDGSTYHRTKATALTAGEVDLSKAGVLNRNADNIAEATTRKWAAESGAQVFTGKSITGLVDRTLGNIADDATYGRTKLTALTAGEVDLSKAGVLNRNADNIAEATTRKWAAESGAQVVTGKSLDILADGTTYKRVKATSLTSGEVDLALAGVLNRNADNIAEATTRKWAAESGADVTSGKSLTVLTNRDLDNIADSASYKRVQRGTLAARPAAGTAGRFYLAYDGGGANKAIIYHDNGTTWDVASAASLANVLDANADNIAEATTRKWAAESGAQVFTGKSWTGLIDRTLGNIADDATYGRTKLTALTSGEVDLSKAGVLNRNADNIAEATTRKWAAESGAQVVTGKDIGILADGATYGRTKLTALTSGEVDMTKSGVLNRNADNIAEATTRKWAAESGADVTSGKSVNVLTDVKTVAQFFTYTQTITATGAGSVTVPTGAKTCVMRAWGGCGSGSKANPDASHGGGGGGGGAKKTVVIKTSDHGGTISHSVGTGAAGVNVVGSGNAGTATTITSTGLSFTNLNISANGGAGGTNAAGGAGGTATGGDTNTSGSAGTFGTASVGGNHAAIDSIIPGKGGNGTDGGTSGAGSAGVVSYTWAG